MVLKTFFSGRFPVILFFAAFSGFAGQAYSSPQDVTAQPAMAAHKALYNVRLVSSKNGSQIVDIRGKMYYEWKPSCEGWITNHRFTLNYEYADAEPLVIASDFSTFESYDGKTLNFSSRRKRDGDVYEELRGKAGLDKNRKGMASYTIPQNLKFDFTSPVLFPTGHTMALLDAARKGTKFLTARVFDGSDDEGAVDINVFIGQRTDGKNLALHQGNIKQASNGNIDRSLLNDPAWKVRMAFFPTGHVAEDGSMELGEADASSDYELSMVFHENGIISDMAIDYADFSIEQKLVALEKVKPETCQPQLDQSESHE